MKTSVTRRNLTLPIVFLLAVFLAGCSCTPVSVPNVVGMGQAAAEEELASAELTLGSVTQTHSATVAPGCVVSQSPAAGTSAGSGMAVALVVSLGVEVPDVVGKPRLTATTAIIAAGLTVGTVTQTYSPSVPVGSVISQNPVAGSSVASGSAVDLILSGTLTVPSVVGQSQEAASSAITAAGLTVGVVTQAFSPTAAAGIVISQTPPGETSAVPGMSVQLTVSQGPPPVEIPNLVGRTQAEAVAAIVHAGLTVGAVTQAYSSTIPAGHVISQAPGTGANVASGTAVAVVVSEGPQPIIVPNLVGMSKTAASGAITDAGLAFGMVTEVYSFTVPSGTVVSQTPAAGASAVPGTAIALTVSKGPPILVPSVLGMTEAAAHATIVNIGLTVGMATVEYSTVVPAGQVLSQYPEGGATVSAGTPVAMVLSNGPPVTVPDVVGREQSVASTAIIDAGLTVGTVTRVFSSSVPLGNVISQTPTGGSLAIAGSAVSLVVSKGPQPVTVPSVVGMTPDAASMVIVGASLTVGTVTQAYSSTVAPGIIVSQTPFGGSSVAPGSVVSLVVSGGPQPVTVPNVVGMTQDAAQTALIAGELVLGAVSQALSPSVPQGSVISQSPAAGASAVPGTPVNVVVSKGPGHFPAIEMVPVPAGTFMMGNSGVGDNAAYGQSCEFPAHQVTLDAYQIGKYPVTNGQYCDVLNFALAQGYLKSSSGTPWVGTNDIYAGGNLQRILYFSSPYCFIQFTDGAFSAKSLTGLPNLTLYSMDTHPVVQVSWWGAVAFCNWYSEMQGLAGCYDMNTTEWPLTCAPPTAGGYRLPTEAEWEFAAAWDGTKRWIYGFASDTLDLSDKPNRCNYDLVDASYEIHFTNPLGITASPHTSPVGWFNGVNVSPNGAVKTVNSASPVGCYDMSGNVWNWCQDWYLDSYYKEGPKTNPTGPANKPATYATRVLRGGPAIVPFSLSGFPILSYVRAAARCNYWDTEYAVIAENYAGFGFRIARTP